MSISYILIIVSAIGFLIALASVLIIKKKKTAKPKPAKIEPQSEPQKKDESFRIARKSKNARVSKKALESDSRSAKIERVFEREPDNQPEAEVQVDELDEENEALVDAISSIESDGRKVVSIGELVRETKIDEAQQTEQQAETREIAPSAESEKVETEFDGAAFLAGLRAERNKPNVQEKPRDFADVIEMDAILNPKFKNKR